MQRLPSLVRIKRCVYWTQKYVLLTIATVAYGIKLARTWFFVAPPWRPDPVFGGVPVQYPQLCMPWKPNGYNSQSGILFLKWECSALYLNNSELLVSLESQGSELLVSLESQKLRFAPASLCPGVFGTGPSKKFKFVTT
jgi:hypothetical protein